MRVDTSHHLSVNKMISFYLICRTVHVITYLNKHSVRSLYRYRILDEKRD